MGKHHRQQPDKVMQFFSIFAQFFFLSGQFCTWTNFKEPYISPFPASPPLIAPTRNTQRKIPLSPVGKRHL